MTEALEETGTLSRGDEAAEADGGRRETARHSRARGGDRVRPAPRRRDGRGAASGRSGDEPPGGAGDPPSRRRHASFATATLAHAAVVEARYGDALNAAAIVERCDEQRPPRECHAVYLSHARGADGHAAVGARARAAHLAVSARGEKGRETRAAWAIAAEAERKMDVVADEAFMEKTLGKDWRAIVSGRPGEGRAVIRGDESLSHSYE